MKPNIVPLIMSNNVPTAVEWFERALGFQEQVGTRQNPAAHTEMRFGAGVIAFRSAVSGSSPLAGVRQATYVTVPDVDDHHNRVAAAGGKIVTPPTQTDLGFREYAVSDLDGHLWFFGDYDMGAGSGNPTFVPECRYRDIVAAKEWLNHVFGFAMTFEVTGPDNTVSHSELRLGDGTVFIGPMTAEHGPWADVRAFVNVIVDNPDQHHARAKAAGADIVIAPHDTPFGARFYAVRDPEHALWWMSTYRPAEPRTNSYES